ncbi:LysR family transcriptional regulator [Rhodococcoides yunnanense]|uniref:LysR family transcriptional regulator n=1 Tax=Rhodococcoides yunnanense TaxID=278209 RepID=A0ABU4BA90_9NOCA|nr:LysR family transcriptional regulator [Rhodococcus yunnanensis]MDV6261041.1 LysR family transcriptional regulator [Rhodococcus yunnanensis]
MLSWDRMKVFAAVAEHGSVTRAAESLHLTGPGVSQHIRKLEKEAGATLVEREGRSIRLTPAGRALAMRAAAMAALAAAAEDDVACIDTAVAGVLRVGAVASALRRVVVPALSDLARTYPLLRLEVVDGEGVDLLARLQRRTLDLVVFESWDHRPASVPAGIEVHTLRIEDVHLAVPADDPRDVADLSDEAGSIWTVCPTGSDANSALVQSLRQTGIEPTIRYEVSDYSTQLAFVEAGLAVALVPETARGHEAGVRYVPTDPVVTRSLCVASSTRIPAIAALLEAMNAIFAR